MSRVFGRVSSYRHVVVAAFARVAEVVEWIRAERMLVPLAHGSERGGFGGRTDLHCTPTKAFVMY
jgi:hypothetical protein